MTVDLATLATKALADDRVATKGPWEVIADDNAQQNIYADHGFDWIAMLPHQCVSSIEDMRVVDAAFIAAARTREPLLAAGVLDLTRQLAEARRIGDAALDHELRLHNEQLRKFSEERLDLTRQLADANRELERWRHGVTIEGDFVCPDSLALSEALRVNVDLTRQLAEARAEIERLNARRFPIMGGPSIPWSLIAPHEGQAKLNHDQTLKELAERGGLAPNELWCVIAGQKLRQLAPEADAKVWLNDWLAAHESAVAEREIDRLRDCVSLQGSRASNAEQQLAARTADTIHERHIALTAIADLTRQLAEANRELERWRHGVTIEGDFVCPDSLALSEALRVNVDLTRQLAEARAGNERLRETYKRVSSVHADRASRTDDLQQQLATARVEADALRAARDGLADLLSGLVHRFERGGAYTARIAELRAVGAKP